MFITKKKLDQMLEDARCDGINGAYKDQNQIRKSAEINRLRKEVRHLKEIVIKLCDYTQNQKLYAGILTSIQKEECLYGWDSPICAVDRDED